MRLKAALERLQRTLSGRAEQALKERDAASRPTSSRDFAAGEAHAYGIAAEDVRQAQLDEEESNGVRRWIEHP